MKRSSLFYVALSLLLFSADSLPVSSQDSPTLLVGQNTRNPLSNWTWDNLERILSELQRDSAGNNSLTRLVSFYFPPGFAKGQVALSVYGAGGIEYIVAREGVRIPGLNTARAVSFAPSIPLQDRDKYPGISHFPQSLYQQGKIILVRSSAPRFIERFISAAKSGTKVQLSDGRNAYYSNESACSSLSPQNEFNSSFVCVSSKLGSGENLRILASIMTQQPIENKN
ncbi:MAG: hypothetical protein MUE44_35530 [Oscillatoriaceae cyanobacterium Prado104]|nr:hypothetical protein [Oscillatoriaceae cyanobacterium Prado104]